MMIDKEVQILRDVARVLERVALRAGLGDDAMRPNEVLSMYEDVEKKMVARYADYPDVIEDIRRSVVEWNMTFFAERDVSFEVIDTLFRRIDKLGYSHLLIEFDIKLIYARSCLEHQKFDEAKIILDSVRDKLSGISNTMTKKNYEKWIIAVEEKMELRK